MKTAELTGAALDYWVAKAEGVSLTEDLSVIGMAVVGMGEPCIFLKDGQYGFASVGGGGKWSPSTDWATGGPIIEREGIAIARFEYENGNVEWQAGIVDGGGYFSSLDFDSHSKTPLVAAMRCFIRSKFGDEVSQPPEKE